MDVLTAIETRQSVSKMRPDPVPRELIEQLLHAAVQAPNHHRNRPWRFTILTGPARDRLGEVSAQALLDRSPDTLEAALDVERRKPLRAPVIIAVGIDRPDGPKIDEIENICAGAAAVQNLLLAAHALGLGAIWRTGKPARSPRVKEFFGLAPDQHLIALVYIGYSEAEPQSPDRPSFEDRTVWFE